MDDNISRKAAIDAMAEKVFHDLTDEFYGAMQVLNELPSTDRKGHWIKTTHTYETIYVCSECCYAEGDMPKRDFCPQCGAKMVVNNMRMIRNLTEMNKLENYLKANGFEYQREDEDAEPMDKHQIIVFENGVRSWDVICHYGSYGSDEGLLEGMGDLFGPDVDGYLTAEDVIKKIEEVRS